MCDKAPVVQLLWARGRALTWLCDEHLHMRSKEGDLEPVSAWILPTSLAYPNIHESSLMAVWRRGEDDPLRLVDYVNAARTIIRQAPDTEPQDPLFIGLYFDEATNKRLTALQDTILQDVWEDIERTPSDRFHITLLYMPHADMNVEAALVEAFQSMQPSLPTLYMDGLREFSTPDAAPLVASIESESRLLRMQAFLYRYAAAVNGGTFSPYSIPINYIPHVTLAYKSPFEGEGIQMNARVQLTPERLVVTRNDYEPVVEVGIKAVGVLKSLFSLS